MHRNGSGERMSENTDVNGKNARFGFVVLHYLVDDATVACVESIRQRCPGAAIVVVDNNSANGSHERLQQRYAADSAVTLLHNDSNEGFARGNNTGYEYARNELHCDFIVTMNNDATVACDDFPALCEEDARRDPSVGVIGPDIVSGRNGSHSNPIYSIIDTRAEVKRQIRRFRVILFLLHLRLFRPLTQLKAKLTHRDAEALPEHVNTTADAVPGKPYKLHGACFVFTPAFVKRFAQAFDPGTFLYFEEDILLMRCREAGLGMLYDKRLRVDHLEDVSTDRMLRQDERRKMIFTLRNYVRSLKVMERYTATR